MSTIKKLAMLWGVLVLLALSFMQGAPVEATSAGNLTTDSGVYAPTKVSGPTTHYETPDSNPTFAFNDVHTWTGNGSDNLPCPGGIHWISNANVLTVSHCLPVDTTTTSPPQTTEPPRTTTTLVTTTTVGESTTTSSPTTTSPPETTSSTTPGTTVVSTTTPPSVTTQPTPGTVPSKPTLPATGNEAWKWTLFAALAVTSLGLLVSRWARR